MDCFTVKIKNCTPGSSGEFYYTRDFLRAHANNYDANFIYLKVAKYYLIYFDGFCIFRL
jgi:hypothetical protein